MNTIKETTPLQINEIAAEHLGDILLEENGNGFSVLEDYREVVEELLKSERGNENEYGKRI